MSTPPPAADETPSLYPNLEAFIERASVDEIPGLFGSIKEQLASLKGPRVEQAKKVERAISCTEELLQHLLSIRAQLEEGRKKP